MATAIIQHEPIGIVVNDGGSSIHVPKIFLWHWASEDETPETEKS